MRILSSPLWYSWKCSYDTKWIAAVFTLKATTGSWAAMFDLNLTLNFLRPDDSWGDRRGPAAAAQPSVERWPTAPPISGFKGDINAHLIARGRLHGDLWTFAAPPTKYKRRPLWILSALWAPPPTRTEGREKRSCESGCASGIGLFRMS